MKDLSIEQEEKRGSSLDMIRQGFSEGFAEGRRTFLRNLLKEKWIEVTDIEKLYSSGLLEPKILKDITLGDLVGLTGLSFDLARRIKDMVLNKDGSFPPEVEKREVEKVKGETKKIHAEVENARLDLEKLEKEYHSLNLGVRNQTGRREGILNELSRLKGEESEGYLKEKRLQDEVLFILNEKRKHHTEAEKIKDEVEVVREELNRIKREFLFTQGECSHLLEKIDYLVSRLDLALHAKEVSGKNVVGFLEELKRVHDRLEDTSRRSHKTYYVNKD